MHNPWLSLSKTPPLVLPSDLADIVQFNRTADDAHCIHTDVFPEPYIGNPDAPVVLLALNPGYCDQDKVVQAQPDFAEAYWKSLRFEPQPYPFYYLDPRFHDTPGSRWWRKRLRALIEESTLLAVAQNILCIQIFPYASTKHGFPKPIPSHTCAVALANQAIDRKAHIVIMRHCRPWHRLVPALNSYPNVHHLKSPMSVYITPRNCPTGYRAIQCILTVSLSSGPSQPAPTISLSAARSPASPT